MRSDRKKQEKLARKEQTRDAKRNRSGFSKFTKVWGLIFLALTLVMAGVLALANILASKYLIAAALIMLLLFIIIFPSLYSYKTKKAQRWIALILSLVVGFVYCVGIWYLAGTMNFMSRITNLSASDEYYVVVRDDDVYNAIEDIEGEVVHGYNALATYDDAVSELRNVVNVDVVAETNISLMFEDLIAGFSNATLVNAGHYDTYSEGNEEFDDYTKVLYSFKMRKKITDIVKPVTVAKEPFNVYITGIDTAGTIDETARSDVNMIATVNPKTRTILLTSIPRDYYVILPDVEAYDKLTHTGIRGADYTVKTVEKLLGIDINYYVKVNFTTVVTMIDAIDGIDIVSEYTFTTSDGRYYFEAGVPKHVDGEEALRFARERYAFIDGDFQRNRDQQIVLEAVIKKVTQSSTLLLNYMSILNALEGKLEMNMSSSDIKSLIRMQTDDMSSWNIVRQTITGATSSEYCYSAGQFASVVLQDQASMNEATDKINAVMAGVLVE